MSWSEREGAWVGSFEVSSDPETGKRRRIKIRARTKQECLRKLRERQAEVRAVGGQAASRTLTVGAIMDDLITCPPSSWRTASSLRANRRHCERVREHLGTVSAVKLTVPQVERMLRDLAAAGLATKTLRDTRSLLRLGLRRAMRDHGLARNVADLADVPRGGRRESRSMDLTEVDLLLGSDLDPW